MKKLIIFSILIGFYACKKETTTVTNTVRDTTTIITYGSGMVHPDSLTAGLQVAYATKVTGTFPAASTDADAPYIDTTYRRSYEAVRSRYLTIFPPVVAGNIAGYYVEIVGAGTHFKVDYTLPKNLRKIARQARGNTRAPLEGNIDGTLLFKLPAAITGDTFFVKYAAYDDQNRVSYPVTARVRLLPTGENATIDSLSGTWRDLGIRYYHEGKFDTDTFSVDSFSNKEYLYFTCENNKLVAADNTGSQVPSYKVLSVALLTFDKYSWTNNYSQYGMTLDPVASTCDNHVYTKEFLGEDEPESGGYSFDPNTRRLTIIQENPTNIGLVYSTFNLYSLTDKELIFYTKDPDDYSGQDANYPLKFFKFIR